VLETMKRGGECSTIVVQTQERKPQQQSCEFRETEKEPLIGLFILQLIQIKQLDKRLDCSFSLLLLLLLIENVLHF
jgi:hypothetical protein